MIVHLGNLARDVIADGPPRVGGGPYHAARALSLLDVPAQIYARCAEADRAELLPPVAALAPTTYVPGTQTATFSFSYDGDVRTMDVTALGDVWTIDDLPELSASVEWLHIAPLARSDFPVETLEACAQGRRVCFDGQGLVRPARTGPLVLDADYDPAMLRSIWALKLSDEEAAVLGDPAALPVPEVLVTHGARGATVYADGRPEEVSAFPVEGVDPTGAGDAFAVSYLVARSEGLVPGDAARRAAAVVARVLA